MNSNYNYSNSLDFEVKNYEESDKSLAKKFPKTVTNKILVNESADSAINKLLDALSLKQKHIAFQSFEFEYDEDEDKEQVFKKRHQLALTYIKKDLTTDEYNEKPSYTIFHNGARNIVIYFKYNNANHGIDELKKFVSNELSSTNEDGYKSSQKQKMLQSLIMLYFKAVLIEEKEGATEGDLDESVIATLNNDAYYLIGTEEKNDETEGQKGKKFVYHFLKPSVFVTAYDEVICSVVYQKYESEDVKSELAVSNGVDFNFVTARKPKNHEWYFNDKTALVKADANSGERGVSFLNLDDLLSCSFFYRNLFTKDIVDILKDSGIENQWVFFEPTKRISSFVTYKNDMDKPPVEFVVVIPDEILDKPQKGNTNFSGNTHSPITYEYTAREAVKCYLEAVINCFYSDYETKITFRPNISYADLDPSVDYVFVQEPKPFHGYWSFSDYDKLNSLKEETNYNIANLGIHFQDDNHPTDVREHDFLKLLDRAFVDGEKNPCFVSDKYTSIKVDSFISKNTGRGRNVVMQGLHIPSSSGSPESMYNLVSKFYLIANKVQGINYGFDFSRCVNELKEDKEAKKSGKLQHKPTELYWHMDLEKGSQKNVHKRIKTDLISKRCLANNSNIPLVHPNNKKALLKGTDGKYRCYFVSKPKIGKRFKFYASFLDIEVVDGVTSILGKGVFIDEDMVRYADKFPISEEAVRYFYNDSFYLVDEKNNVLLCYSGMREEQPLSAIYKDECILDFIRDKALGDIVDPKDHKGCIGINKDMNSPESSYLGFYALSSKGNKSKFEKGRTTSTWLYIQENNNDLLLFASPKNPIQGKKKVVGGEEIRYRGSLSTSDRIYRIKVTDTNGDIVDAKSSKLTALYLQTATFNINHNNDYSFRSILHTLTKIVLNN